MVTPSNGPIECTQVDALEQCVRQPIREECIDAAQLVLKVSRIGTPDELLTHDFLLPLLRILFVMADPKSCRRQPTATDKNHCGAEICRSSPASTDE
jgi:hypothetical protein